MNTDLPRWADVVVIPLVNILIAFLASGLVVLIIGASPLDALRILIEGAFGQDGIGYTLFYATDFIFTGLGVAVAFHAGLCNIGGDGQATIAGLGVALVCLTVSPHLPFLVVLPLGLLGAFVFGAAWAFLPGYLQARRGSHVVITTIMFNFIASALMVYLLVDVLKPNGDMNPETASFPPNTAVPTLNDIGAALGFDLGLTSVNLTFPIALVAAVLVWLLVWKTRIGYELRTVGHNPVAAVYAGISPRRITILAMLLSGGLSGLLAVNEIMGYQSRLILDFTAGAGFVGIAVSLMGRSHPFGIVLAAILFGALYQGGAELAFEIPAITRDMVVMIRGMVILFAGALEQMFRPQLAALFRRLEPARRPVQA